MINTKMDSQQVYTNQNENEHTDDDSCVPMDTTEDLIENLMEDLTESTIITCWGCRENQPNQEAHMDYGGCLYIEE